MMYPCGLCEGENFTTLLKQKDKYQQQVSLTVCNNCGLLQLNPRLSSQEASDFYKSEYYLTYADDSKFSNPEFLNKKKTIALGILESVEASRSLRQTRLLDIGSGLGFLLEAAQDRNADVFSVEPDLSRSKQLEEKRGQCFSWHLTTIRRHPGRPF